MESPEIDAFWDDCPLTGRDPEMMHGAPVLKNERGELTRLPADTLVENIEAFMELEGPFLIEFQPSRFTVETSCPARYGASPSGTPSSRNVFKMAASGGSCGAVSGAIRRPDSRTNTT